MDNKPKYSENVFLKTCYAMGVVITVIVIGVSYCITKVIKNIT